MNEIDKTHYQIWIQGLKKRFLQSQIKASVSVNSVLLEFYWELGCDIVAKQKESSWGDSFLEQLSKDLMQAFPEVKGFSLRNLQQIRKWYLFYYPVTIQNTKQVVSQICSIPWGHNILIVQKSHNTQEALFYVEQTLKNGWSRNVLSLQIKSGLYDRSAKAVTNFQHTLPRVESDLAKEVLKDPYNFDFLTLSENFQEKELERNLIEHLEKFLLELGSGFAFVGRQYKVEVSDKEYFIDLLFYHLKLRCYIVIELKSGEFKPEYAGKLNFYCNIVDDHLCGEFDHATIGLLLCQDKDNLIVEYALRDMNKPIGVSSYELQKVLPKEYASVLPSIEEIEEELIEKTKEGEDRD